MIKSWKLEFLREKVFWGNTQRQEVAITIILMWKFLVFYGIYVTLDAIYDSGVYFRFFLYGPSYLRQIAKID